MPIPIVYLFLGVSRNREVVICVKATIVLPANSALELIMAFGEPEYFFIFRTIEPLTIGFVRFR